MSQQTLVQIASQLESENSKDRMLALAALRNVSPEDAVPLIQKVLNDENLQIRSMAVFALGVKPTPDCYPILVKILENDPDYGIRADAAGAGFAGSSGFSPCSDSTSAKETVIFIKPNRTVNSPSSSGLVITSAV